MTGQSSQVWEVLHDAKQQRFALKILLSDKRSDRQQVAFMRHEWEVGAKLNCSRKKLRLPLRQTLKDLRTFFRVLHCMGVRRGYRRLFWRTLGKLAWRNPRGLRYSVALLALYLHFGEFRKYLVARLGDQIRAAERAEIARGVVSAALTG